MIQLAPAVNAIIVRNLRVFMAEAPRFQRVFGIRLFDYWTLLEGFDFVKFDTWLMPDENESLGDVVRARYGDQAFHCVRRLCGVPYADDDERTAGSLHEGLADQGDHRAGA